MAGLSPSDAPRLIETRSLHYFLPIIEEILRDPPPTPYIDYLREVMAERMSDRPAPVPAQVQKTTFLDER